MAMTTGGTPSDAIRQAVSDSIKSGKPLVVATADLIAASPLADLPVVSTVIPFAPGEDPLADLGLYRLAALFPGLPLAQWLPREGLLSPLTSDNSLVSVDQMGFEVLKDSNGGSSQLVGLSVGVALGRQRAGFSVTVLDALNITATLSHINLVVQGPFASPFVTATLSGSLTFGALDLDVAVDCPSFTFTATEPPGSTPSFKALLQAFKLPSPASFANLLLSGLQLTVMSRDKAVDFTALVTTPNGQPFSILDGVLALDSLTLGVQYAQDATSASIAAQLLIHDKIALGVVLMADTASGAQASSSWTAAAGLDLPATLANLGKPQATSLLFGDLLGALGLNLPTDMQSFLDHFALEALDGSVTIPQAGATTWQLHVAFTTNWTLGGIAISTDTDAQLGGDSNTIVGTLDIDGFALVLTFDFSSKQAGGGTILSVSAPKLAGLVGTFDVSQNKVTLSTSQQTTLGQLLADFVAIFTGNSFTTLPAPWDLLNDIGLSSFSLSITLGQTSRVIEIDYEGLDFDFLGCSVTGFGLVYDSAKAKTGSGFSFTVKGNFPMLGTSSNPSWDPTQPSQAPTAPGLGAAYLDVVLAAFGQHVGLPTQPVSVEDALIQIQNIVAGISEGNPLPVHLFDKDAGWLIGARMILLGQIDVRLVFADPQIYGVHLLVRDDLNIEGAPKSDYLDALVGLSAEILYRKVSATIGVYEAYLTLPDKIRKINMEAFEVQLPSLGVKVFTNGDFEIDIGYPHNGDFSHSAVIAAAEYYGSGGLLFGKLSGATDDKLPPIAVGGNNLPVGAFGNVIEIGLGFRIGIYREFSAGPMSASLGVLLQGIFQGTFSKFTRNPSGGQQVSEDYYNVYASLTIIGKLEGKIDFAIISASLLVEITISVAVTAETRRQVTVPMTASVDVELTVSINCGLFTIHIHVGFSTTVSYTATFGTDTWQDALWNKTSSVAMLQAERMFATALAAPPPIAYPPLSCQPLALDLYVVPQLTLGLASPTASQPDWIYVVQTALMSPQAKTPSLVRLAGATGPSPANEAVKLFTAWLLQAYQSWARGVTPASAPTPDALYQAITVLPADLDGLSTYLSSIGQPGSTARAPSSTELQSFFGANLLLTAQKLLPGSDYGLAFFPLLPGTTVSVSSETVPIATTDLAVIVSDYLRITVQAALHGASQLIGTSPMTLSTLYDLMEQTSGGAPSAMSSAVGNGTRFMLHGTRIGQQALYSATGQEAIVADPTAPSPTVDLANAAARSWGLVTPTQPIPIGIQIPTSVTGVDDSSALAATMSLAASAPRSFTLANGQPGKVLASPGTSAYLRSLPPALISTIAGADASRLFHLQTLDAQNVAHDVPATAYAWCATISFTVRRVPTAESTGAKPTYLANVYELFGVQSDDLRVLEKIYQRKDAQPPTALEIAYVAGSGGTGSGALSIQLVTAQQTFIFRSNVSTETNPPHMLMAVRGAAAAAAPDPAIITFIEHMMTGGLTNSGGYYLYFGAPAPLPDSLFDSDGLGQLQLVVSFNLAQQTRSAADFGAALDGTVNAARVSDPAAGADPTLFAAAWTLQDLHATAPTGNVGIRVTRLTPPSTSDYQATLDNLFHLLAFVPQAPVTARGKAVPIVNPPRDQFVTGPLRDDAAAAQGRIAYQRLFNLLELTGNAWPSDPPDLSIPAPPILWETLRALDPYMFIGGSLSLGFEWIDLYGDMLPSRQLTTSVLPVGYTDPVAGLGDWPHLVYGYMVQQVGGQRVLTLKRTFVYQKDDDVRRTNNLKRTYATIYHQLADIDASVTVSFLSQPLSIPSGGGRIAELLQADINAIMTAVDARTGCALPDLSLTLPADDASYRTDALFPLTATMTFKRGGPVDPNFASDPAISVMTTVLSPYYPTEAGSSVQSYTVFATAFEQALTSTRMKVLAGDADVPGGAQLWIMRYGAGALSVAFAPPTGFAPKPLAYAPPGVNNTLISRGGISGANLDALIAQQTPSNVFLLGATAMTATDLDLDGAFANFLAMVENFLAPDCGIPATLHDTAVPNAVDRCLAAKRDLATRLSGRVVSLADGKTTSPAATEAYRQSCLISLSNFYGIDAVVQTETTTSVGQATWPEGLNLNLYGRSVGAQSTTSNNNVTVSPGKVALSPTAAQPLALTLSAHRKGEEAVFSLPQTFQIDAFEDVTGTLNVPDGAFNLGTWLRFVLAADATLTMQPANIALPLRAYPRPPIINAQTFGSQVTTGDNPLASADEWSLELGYQHVFVAQDTLNVTVVINIGEQPRRVMLAAARVADDLVDTLTQFATIYGAGGPSGGIGAVFNNLRRTGTADHLSDALVAFATTVEHVAGSLDVPIKLPQRMPSGRSVGDNDGGVPFNFTVQEWFDARLTPESAPWRLKVVADPNNPTIGTWHCPLPTMRISIDGVTYSAVPDDHGDAYFLPQGKTDPADGLKADKAMSVAARTLAVEPLSIIDHHNGAYQLSIARNAGAVVLEGNTPVRVPGLPQPFEYLTPVIKAPDKVLPFIDKDLDPQIDISKLPLAGGGPVATTLTDALTRLYVNLLTGVTNLKSGAQGSVQTVIDLVYPVQDGPNPLALPDRVLPVLLDLPEGLPFYPSPGDVAPLVAKLVAALGSWRNDNRLPATLLARSTLQFEVSVFSTISETGIPLIHLRGLYVAAAGVSWT
ncbi:hypothetical protein [Bradyrhizobium sp. HKCCYLS20291]|uniref:hypothetical protein n=1 Tax=Bradyrhizobium sp. HKCCYLS20291 TaxID=3420766 RepID=UPI003EB7C487